MRKLASKKTESKISVVVRHKSDLVNEPVLKNRAQRRARDAALKRQRRK